MHTDQFIFIHMTATRPPPKMFSFDEIDEKNVSQSTDNESLLYDLPFSGRPLYRSSSSEDELRMPTDGRARLRNIKAESSEHKKYYKQHSTKSPVLFIAGDILPAFMFLFFLRLRLLLNLFRIFLSSELTIRL